MFSNVWGFTSGRLAIVTGLLGDIEVSEGSGTAVGRTLARWASGMVWTSAGGLIVAGRAVSGAGIGIVVASVAACSRIPTHRKRN